MGKVCAIEGLGVERGQGRGNSGQRKERRQGRKVENSSENRVVLGLRRVPGERL